MVDALRHKQFICIGVRNESKSVRYVLPLTRRGTHTHTNTPEGHAQQTGQHVHARPCAPVCPQGQPLAAGQVLLLQGYWGACVHATRSKGTAGGRSLGRLCIQQRAQAQRVEGVWGACVFDKEHRHCGWKDFGAPVYSTKSKGTAGGRSQGRMCACAKGQGHCPALLLRAHVCNERVAALLPQQVQGLPDW